MGGSLRSPPTRNLHLYYNFDHCPSVKWNHILIPQEASRCSSPFRFLEPIYIIISFVCFLSICLTKRDFLLKTIVFTEMLKLILMVRSSKKSFWGSLCSVRNTFSYATGARAREAGFFSWINFFLLRRLTYFNGPKL